MKTNETNFNQTTSLQYCHYDSLDNCIYTEFSVPTLWLLKHLDMTPNELEDFLNKYNSEDSLPIYESAVLQNMLVNVEESDTIYKKERDSICYSLKTPNQEFEVKTKITAEFLEDVVITAFETGVDYWCVVDDNTPIWSKYYDVDLPFSQCLFELLYKGAKIELFDIENHKTRWFLTWDKLLQGITIYNGCYHSDMLDSMHADNIIQCALFGEVMFSY